MTPRWTPGIGDPTPVGWITAICYFLVAALCLAAAANRGLPGRGARERRFWLMLAGCFLILCVNKQLDLQSLFTELARDDAQRRGWYAGRRPFQLAFITGLAVMGAGAAGLLGWRLRHSGWGVRTALLGLIFTLCFVLTRAASFHHVDQFLAARLGNWRMNWLLELGGIAIVALGALQALRRPDPQRPS